MKLYDVAKANYGLCFTRNSKRIKLTETMRNECLRSSSRISVFKPFSARIVVTPNCRCELFTFRTNLKRFAKSVFRGTRKFRSESYSCNTSRSHDAPMLKSAYYAENRQRDLLSFDGI